MAAADVEIVTCIITDEDSRAYLMHRYDHDQWQFPGGRRLGSKAEDIAFPLEAPESTAVRLLDEALMITADPQFIRNLGLLTLSHGGVSIEAHMMEVPRYSGDALCLGYKNYDAGEFVDLNRRNLRNLSPTVQAFIQKMRAGEVALLPRDTVQ